MVTMVAGFAAGVLNAVAGGGSFLTLPALVFAGLPPLSANATGTVALLPGYIASAAGFRRELASIAPRGLMATLLLSLCGGAAGAGLLLFSGDHAFRSIVPYLLLLATVLFAASPWLLAQRMGREAGPLVGAVALAMVAIYGGYFNGGLGILLLAMYGLLGEKSLNRANALKNLVSSVLTCIAVGVYAVGGVVDWHKAVPMMGSTIVGGYVGARFGQRLSPQVLRALIVLTGLGMSLIFFRKV